MRNMKCAVDKCVANRLATSYVKIWQSRQLIRKVIAKVNDNKPTETCATIDT